MRNMSAYALWSAPPEEDIAVLGGPEHMRGNTIGTFEDRMHSREFVQGLPLHPHARKERRRWQRRRATEETRQGNH